jgi:hypothetical protein
MRALGSLVLVGAVALLGCGSSTETASDGRIIVTVSTRGAEPQSSEYLLTLNGARLKAVRPDGSAVYDEVPEGTHVVHLFSLADNCVVSGSPQHRSVRVAGDTVEVTFSVLCSVPLSGGFHIVVSSAGTEVDEDGYQLSVAGTPLRSIGVNTEEHYEGLEPGMRLISLKDVASFCEVAGSNPKPLTVIAGNTVRVSFSVRCGEETPVE